MSIPLSQELKNQLKSSDKLMVKDKSEILQLHKSSDNNFIPMNLENRTFCIANKVILGCMPMTIYEAKMFRILLSQVSYYGDDNPTHSYTLKPYRAKVSDLANKLGIKGKSCYEKVQNICVSLHTRYLFVKKGDEWESYSLVVKVSYQRGYITLHLNEHLKDFVYGLDEFFSIYQLESILSFSQKHSLRIYEAIKCRIGQNKKLRTLYEAGEPIQMTLKMDDLREITATLNKYPQFFDFKKNVIQCAIAEIDEKSDIYLTHLNTENQTKDDDFVFEITKKPIVAGPDIQDVMLANTFVTKEYITTLLTMVKHEKEKEIKHVDELFNFYEGEKAKFDKDFLYALQHAHYSVGAYIFSLTKSDKPEKPNQFANATLEFTDKYDEEAFREIFELVFSSWNNLADMNQINGTHGILPVHYKTLKCRNLLKQLLDEGITVDEILAGIEIANTSLFFLNNHNNFAYFLNHDNFKSIVNGDELVDYNEMRMATAGI